MRNLTSFLTTILFVALGAVGLEAVPLHQVIPEQERVTLAADAAQPSLLSAPARIHLIEVPLQQALRELQMRSGVPLAYSPSLLLNESGVVSCRCTDVSVGFAIRTLLEGRSFEVVALPTHVVIRDRGHDSNPGNGTVAGAATPSEVGPTGDSSPAVEAPITGSIQGVVTSGTGRPLGGAQVTVVGTSHGAITNPEGRYAVRDVAPGEYTITAQVIGYSQQSRTVTVVTGQVATANFQLSDQAIALDEIVVTGTAGRQERRAQGAVVANVNVANIAERTPITNVTEAIHGRIPGVSINQSSGVSGGGQQIRIRGAASISLSNEPLVYVDGIRIDRPATSVTSGSLVNHLNDLHPSEIESIEVVKGPAAATLYGADASAGVIQVITKRGISGMPFQQQVGLRAGVLQPTFTSEPNFATCTAANIGSAELCAGRSPGDVVSDRPLERTGYPLNGQVRSLSWSGRGGGASYGFFGSLGIDQDRGLYPNNEYQRVAARLNYNIIPSDNLRLEFNLPITRSGGDFPVTGGSSRGWTIGGWAGNPLTVGTATDGFFATNRGADALRNIEQEYYSTRLIPHLKLDYDPQDWWSHRLSLGTDLITSEQSAFFPKNDQGWYSSQENRGQVEEHRRNRWRFTANYLTTVDRPLTDRWGSTLSLGTELQAEREDYSYAFGNGLTINSARSVAAAAQTSGSQEVFHDRRVGFFGQWEPNYNELLYLQFGLRADRFAAFGADAPWFLSPSVRTSYVISDAPFWNVDWVPSLRLRAAYGTTGRAPEAGVALRTFTASPYLTHTGSVESGIVPLNVGNPDLRAERGTELEAGFDASLLSDRVGLEFTFFEKRTRDLLLRVPIPASLGFVENPFRNIGEVLNRGLELGLNSRLLQTSALTWDLGLNLSTLKNEVLDMGGLESFATMRFGFVNGVKVGYQAGGYFTQRVRSVDLDQGVAIVSDTLEFVGNLYPSREASLSSTLTMFDNLRLYAHVQTKQDFYLYNATALYRERTFGIGENWVRQNEVLTEDERLRRFGPYVSESGEPVGVGSVLGEYIEPADFVRLSEVSLAYDIPASFVGRVLRGSRRASVTLSGRNLALWSDYSGFDPDINNETDAIAGRADFFTLPPPRQLAVEFNVWF